MTARSGRPILAPADLTRFFVAFGLVPLLSLRIDPTLAGPPWSFVLTPGWSPGQLLLVTAAGLVLGATSARPAQGLVAAILGVLLGLAVDLWWFAGQVTPADQTFVSALVRDEWVSRATVSAIALSSAIAAGFLIGALLRWLIRSDHSLGRPAVAEVAVIGIVIVGVPVLALGIASAAAASALVIPAEAQVQTVSVSADAIELGPGTLRAGPTHFRCRSAPDGSREWLRLVVAPEDADTEWDLRSLEEPVSICSPRADTETWGSIADMRPGRYAWIQSEPLEVPRLISTSPVFAVEP